MDAPRFDRLSKALAGANSRRSLVQAAAALAIAAVPALAGDAADARRGTRQGVGAEHWHHKKRLYCLDGKTVRRYRRQQKRLLAQGATLGKCGKVPPPPCVPTTCEALGAVCAAPDGCGGTLDCGTCSGESTCCTGKCVFTDLDPDNCGACGNVCEFDCCNNGGQCCIP